MSSASDQRRGRVFVALAAIAWSTAGLLQRELTVGTATQLAGRAFFALFGVLEPWRERIELVALGGDRRAVDELLAAEPRLAWLAEKRLERFFTTEDPRQRTLERLPYDLYAAEVETSAPV